MRDDEFDAHKDLQGSMADCLRAVRERVAAGGKPWAPQEWKGWDNRMTTQLVADQSLPLEARLALEWFRASGERTSVRLMNLVAHFCETNGIREPDTKAAIYEAARRSAFKEGV